MPFPSPPWQLRARAWLSLFRIGGVADRPAGLYAAAFVDYQPGGVLAYHELLVARLVGVRSVSITDIWVDSAASLAGGRSLWAIPKEPAELPFSSDGSTATCRAVRDAGELVRASFRPLPSPALLRVPFVASTSQQREDGSPVTTPFGGSGRVAPCRAEWQFAADGRLGFLAGRRPLVSLAVRDVSLRFG